MIMTKHINKFLVLFASVACLVWQSGCASTDNGQTDTKVFSDTSGGITVEVYVSSSTDIADCKARASWRWGAEFSCPKTQISSISVRLNNESVYMPLSTFADLGNPHKVKIKPVTTEKDFGLVITGGDAATSYTAELRFKNGVLQERIVKHGEFPNESWERTTYKFNF